MKSINLSDPKGRVSIIYSIKSNDISAQGVKLERLHSESEDLGDKVKRKFFVSSNEVKEILVLSLMKEKVFVNIATVSKDTLKLASVSTKISFIETETSETVELYYTPTSQRKIFVIDLETGDEIEPELNILSTGETKGIIYLEVGKKYLAIEFRDSPYRTILAGACQVLLEDESLKLSISKDEAKMISLDKYIELIGSGKSIEQKLSDVTPEKER